MHFDLHSIFFYRKKKASFAFKTSPKQCLCVFATIRFLVCFLFSHIQTHGRCSCGSSLKLYLEESKYKRKYNVRSVISMCERSHSHKRTDTYKSTVSIHLFPLQLLSFIFFPFKTTTDNGKLFSVF